MSRRFIKLFLSSSTILLLIMITVASVKLEYIPMSPTLSITAATNQLTYHLRQNVNVSGTLMSDGSPVSDALVAMEVRNPRDDHFAYRTIPIGDPSEDWSVTITEALVLDSAGDPTDKVKINSVGVQSPKLSFTVRSNMANQLTAYATATILDGNFIPVYVNGKGLTLAAFDEETIQWSCPIYEWAYAGKATVHINVYDNYPHDVGVPYVPEKTVEFYITRNLELGHPYSPPKNSYTTLPGQYNLTFQVPPDQYTLPGNYSVYVTGRVSLFSKTFTSTAFGVESLLCPPQAAFTYSPLEPYQNMTITFDASSSSAEGYNDFITSYEWDINDPYDPAHLVGTTPFVTHTFEYGGTFIVELNVTDNEGLWSATSKPITILPEFGPTANFTWSPESTFVNETITFDASNSTTGWSAETQQFSPIVSYIWNFSDGTGNITVASPMLNHNFTQPGNYTVRLTVVDAVDRSDTTWNTVEVQNVTLKDADLNNDGVIDGSDLVIVTRAFGSYPGHPDWNPIADINEDGVVDGDDLLPITRYFGEDP